MVISGIKTANEDYDAIVKWSKTRACKALIVGSNPTGIFISGYGLTGKASDLGSGDFIAVQIRVLGLMDIKYLPSIGFEIFKFLRYLNCHKRL